MASRIFSVLPTAPLTRAIEREYPSINAAFAGRDSLRRQYAGAVALGRISVELADKICIRVLGYSPSVLYGDDFFMAPMRAKSGCTSAASQPVKDARPVLASPTAEVARGCTFCDHVGACWDCAEHLDRELEGAMK